MELGQLANLLEVTLLFSEYVTYIELNNCITTNKGTAVSTSDVTSNSQQETRLRPLTSSAARLLPRACARALRRVKELLFSAEEALYSPTGSEEKDGQVTL